MLTFDTPSPFGPQGRRNNSNVPAQALTLMNDPFVVQQSRLWADRMLEQIEWSDHQRIAEMIEIAHGVEPSSDQVDRLERFLSKQTLLYGESFAGRSPRQNAWSDLAHAFFNMKSFYFLR